MAFIIDPYAGAETVTLWEFNVQRLEGYKGNHLMFNGSNQRVFAENLLRVAQHKMEEHGYQGMPHVRIVSDGEERLSMKFAVTAGTNRVIFTDVTGLSRRQKASRKCPIQDMCGESFLEALNLHEGDKVIVEVKLDEEAPAAAVA